jgi:transcriptional regulator with GAF, ATPase, and Fis domain
MTKQLGRFELANESTIFLDEVGELPMEMQAKLLRVLQEKQIERLGGGKSIPVDVRIIAATNRNLAEDVRCGRFREDLYYRLNVFPITIPPLRDRLEDVPVLVNAFMKEFATQQGKQINAISRASLDALQRYVWPGNVRELRNIVERAVIMAGGPSLQVDLPQQEGSSSMVRTLEEMEREYIVEILRRVQWRVRGSGGAAEVLGMNPSTLESRMKKLGINRPRARATTFRGLHEIS